MHVLQLLAQQKIVFRKFEVSAVQNCRQTVIEIYIYEAYWNKSLHNLYSLCVENVHAFFLVSLHLSYNISVNCQRYFCMHFYIFVKQKNCRKIAEILHKKCRKTRKKHATFLNNNCTNHAGPCSIKPQK